MSPTVISILVGVGVVALLGIVGLMMPSSKGMLAAVA